ncbi:MAG: glycosyltransferase [Acidobacteriota bacterium]
MLRVLMLDNEFPPLGGGTGVVNQQLLDAWSRLDDVSVDLVTSSRAARGAETQRFAERITVYKVPVANRDIHHATNTELLRFAARGLRASLERCDQVRYDLSFAYAGVPAGGISYALERLRGLPYVISLQGPDVPGFERRYRLLYPLLRPVLRRIWRHAESVVAISEEMAALARQTDPHVTCAVVPNGVDATVFHPVSTRASNTVHVLSVGRLIERKGHHHLLRAFASLMGRLDDEVRLTLVGTGDAESALRALVDDLRLGDRVTFAGVVARERMPAIYRDADVFVLPSDREGMSIALLEALASGLPAVVTAHGGTEGLVVDGVNGYTVAPGDVPALAEALARLLGERHRWPAMGASSRQLATTLSWTSYAERYLALCRTVAARRRRS